jgi:hypothetical protein
MLPAGFKPANPATNEPQTLALHHSVTGIGYSFSIVELKAREREN